MMSDEVGSALVRQLARALPGALDDEGLEKLAAKLRPYFADRQADERDARQLMTVAEVAARLRTSPKWVYAHQHRLGAIKLGDGPKARLRFNARAVAELERTGREIDPDRDVNPQQQAKVKRTRRRLLSRPLRPIGRGSDPA